MGGLGSACLKILVRAWTCQAIARCRCLDSREQDLTLPLVPAYAPQTARRSSNPVVCIFITAFEKSIFGPASEVASCARFWTFATVEIKGVPFIAITQNMNFVVFVSDFDPPRVLSDPQRRTQSTGGEGGDSDPSSSV
jgi:hypothetical protein